MRGNCLVMYRREEGVGEGHQRPWRLGGGGGMACEVRVSSHHRRGGGDGGDKRKNEEGAGRDYEAEKEKEWPWLVVRMVRGRWEVEDEDVLVI
ncbi:hypothetical protein AgCh_016523 [Apium graveolens]